jgi:hypothetical protein
MLRKEAFRLSIPAVYLDEAHVLSEWKKEGEVKGVRPADFRREYRSISALQDILGSSVPWSALSATMTTEVFEDVFKVLNMGVHRPFWSIDLGSDRPNVRYEMRRMQHSAQSFGDILGLLPLAPNKAEDLKKTIIYMHTRDECLRLAALLRQRVKDSAPGLEEAIYPFTGSSSADFRPEALARLRSGQIRWLVATGACGMGLDIPDIEQVITSGIKLPTTALQEAGRASRRLSRVGLWIWILPHWIFDPELEPAKKSDETNGKKPVEPTKKRKEDEERREHADAGLVRLVHALQTGLCLRRVAIDIMRPEPQLDGFPGCTPRTDREFGVDFQHVEPSLECARVEPCCTSCAKSTTLDTASPWYMHAPSEFPVVLRTTQRKRGQRRCPEAEREVLEKRLEECRKEVWRTEAGRNPFLDPDWFMSDVALDQLVKNAHKLLNAPDLNERGVRDLGGLQSTPASAMPSIVEAISRWRKGFVSRQNRRKRQQTQAEENDASSEESVESEESGDEEVEEEGVPDLATDSSAELLTLTTSSTPRQCTIPAQNPTQRDQLSVNVRSEATSPSKMVQSTPVLADFASGSGPPLVASAMPSTSSASQAQHHVLHSLKPELAEALMNHLPPQYRQFFIVCPPLQHVVCTPLTTSVQQS